MKFCGECAASLKSRCPHCGGDNPPGFKFCGQCAAPLRSAPVEPRRTLPADPRAGAALPRHLAEKIRQSRSALEGERKQVTVLFADVKGSMELAEQLDPEEWSQSMSRFFQILAEGVERFEGFVDKFTGDGIMALFGAPIAHEDHAQRACYAALHLRDALRRHADEVRRTQGLSFSVRIGLNSGDVVVGTIGDDLRMGYTAQGHVVGLAARLEQLAEPGKALLTEYTAKLVAGYFQLRDLGSFTIKGVARPLRVHELEGLGQLRTRLDLSRARGFSKFVGRQEEMAALDAAVERALGGRGQVVGVVADAGTGKSRLCFELLQRCRARGIAVYEGRCVAHGKMIPFLPILELFRAYYGVSERDGEQAAREKIAGRMLLLDETLRDALPLVFDFMGVPDPERPAVHMEPEARQRHFCAIVKQVMQARSRREPAVTLLEDLHWIDGSSEAIVTALVEATAGTRSLLLVNFRPEYHAAWMQQSYYQQLPLLPLGEQAVTELLGELLGTDPSLDGLPERIRERTAGNPFFIEEVVRSLIDERVLVGGVLTRPVTAIQLPPTVQAVLAARIDRLAEDEKCILQTAAVIGKEFAEPVLQRVVSPLAALGGASVDLAATLRALTQAEFLYEQALYPEVEYAFKHPLTQEVAYHSQLSARRVATHRAVAEVLTERYADSLDERAALIAYHWESAGELLAAAQWYRRAADWVATSDVSEAHGHWEKVRALLGTLPESASTLALGVAAHVELVNLSWRLGIESQSTAALFEAGRTLAERTHDARSLALLLSNYSIGGGHDTDQAFAYYTEAVRLASQTDDTALRVSVGCMLGPHALAGRLREALQLAEQVLDLAGGDPRTGAALIHFNAVAWLFTLKGFAKSLMGRGDEGTLDFDRAAQLVAQYGESLDQLVLHQYQAWWARLCGEAKLTLDHARRTVEYADRVGGPFWEWQVWGVLGQAHALNSAWDEAIPLLEQAVVTERRLGLRFGFFAPQLAAGYFEQGMQQRARALVSETITTAQSGGSKLTELEAQLVRADILVRTEGANAGSAAEAVINRAEALAQETGARIYLPQIHVERARLAGILSDPAGRLGQLREAYRLFTEMGAVGHAERVAKELASS